MSMKDQVCCAVPGCGRDLKQPSNMCDEHFVPGMVMSTGSSTMVVTAWYAEHNGSRGVILLNDWALGTLFGGTSGFEQELAKQGFTAIANLGTRADIARVRQRTELAPWSGPWSTSYPWEVKDEE